MLSLPTPLYLQVSGIGGSEQTPGFLFLRWTSLSLSYPQILNSDHIHFTKIMQQIEKPQLPGSFEDGFHPPEPIVSPACEWDWGPKYLALLPTLRSHLSRVPIKDRDHGVGIVDALPKPGFSRISWGLGNSRCYSLSSSLQGPHTLCVFTTLLHNPGRRQKRWGVGVEDN